MHFNLHSHQPRKQSMHTHIYIERERDFKKEGSFVSGIKDACNFLSWNPAEFIFSRSSKRSR
jgi:hypothetical protein